MALLLVAVVLSIGVYLRFFAGGFSARQAPSRVEEFIARRVRKFSIPAGASAAANPIALSASVLADARAHFADHCALCHANDGSGKTELGENLYPPAPDMRRAETRQLTDGELFFIIHNGIRFTGMPAWGPPEVSDDTGSWKLVHFIRHLPNLTDDELREMETMNPKSAHQLEEEAAVREFLSGGGAPSASSESGSHND